MISPGDAAFAHCRELIAQADKVRYWATLYAPEQRRGALFALYAFDLEVAAVSERVRQPLAGEIRLQWWREVLEAKRSEEAAANPAAAALLSALDGNGIGAEPLLGLIEARRFDVYDEPMATINQFEIYARATAGAVYRVAVQLLGASGTEADEICDEIGLAQAYLGAIRDVGGRPRGGRHIPGEIFDRYGAERETMADATASFELRAALAEMRLHARRHLARAAASLQDVSEQTLPALLPAAVIKPMLARMEGPDCDPLRPPWMSALRQQWLIWRAAREPARMFG